MHHSALVYLDVGAGAGVTGFGAGAEAEGDDEGAGAGTKGLNLGPIGVPWLEGRFRGAVDEGAP